MSESEETEWEVHKVVGCRMTEDGVECRVKWIGWTGATWEPLSNLENCRAKLKRYIKLEKDANRVLSGDLAECIPVIEEFVRPRKRRQKDTPQPVDPNRSFWSLIEYTTVAANLDAFLPSFSTDTTDIDGRWYPSPVAMTIPPELDYHIEGIGEKNGRMFATVSGPHGVSDEDFDTIKALFPAAVQRFMEKWKIRDSV
jgi:hypothetical protein